MTWESWWLAGAALISAGAFWTFVVYRFIHHRRTR